MDANEGLGQINVNAIGKYADRKRYRSDKNPITECPFRNLDLLC